MNGVNVDVPRPFTINIAINSANAGASKRHRCASLTADSARRSSGGEASLAMPKTRALSAADAGRGVQDAKWFSS
jgi:hypothetical protein